MRLSVIARGSAPTQLRLRAASATAAMAPRSGSRATQRFGQSTTAATPRLDAAMAPSPCWGRSRTTAASAPPGGTTVLTCTWWSYWRYTHRFEAMVGSSSNSSRAPFQLIGSSAGNWSSLQRQWAWISAGGSLSSSWWLIGVSSARALAGTSAATSPFWSTRTTFSCNTRPTTAACRPQRVKRSISTSSVPGFTTNSIRSWDSLSRNS